jgi:D-alanyl-D-alanine carboxypeptidase (penicillin-binding protein 5/6)
MDKIEHKEGRFTEISNTNKLIRFYNGCDAGKTGFTSEAGHCLTASAIKNGMRLIAVVIKSPDSKTRFKEISEMFNYGFANFTNKTIIDNSNPLSYTAKINNGKKETVELIAENSFSYLCKKDEKTNFEVNIELDENLCAPITKYQKVGKINIYKDGIKITSINVLANEDINNKTYIDYLYEIIKNYKICS